MSLVDLGEVRLSATTVTSGSPCIWQRNLGSRVVMPSTAGPHTYALRRKVYYVRRDAQAPRARLASGVLTAQRPRKAAICKVVRHAPHRGVIVLYG